MKTFSGKKYNLLFDWGNHIDVNLEDGKSFLGNNKCFFEIFFDNYHFRGDSDLSLEDAEKSAWNKYETYKKCKHNPERIGKTGLGKCLTCGTFGLYFDNIEKCCISNCDHAPIHYLNKDKQLCLKHFLSYDKEDSNIEDSERLFYKILFEGKYLDIDFSKKENSKKIKKSFMDFNLISLDIAENIALEGLNNPFKTIEEANTWNRLYTEYKKMISLDKDFITEYLKGKTEENLLTFFKNKI